MQSPSANTTLELDQHTLASTLTSPTSYRRYDYITMDEHELSLEAHRYWVENICSTPSPVQPLPHRYDPWQIADGSPEHVLRGSRSFAARSFRSRPAYDGSRVPSDRTNDENADFASNGHQSNTQQHVQHGVLGEIASNGQMLRNMPMKLRPSPTPSLKRKKAEAIVRAHGSPTHVRVTAGGRIVPREQSPLCFPRFGYSAIKVNGGLIKFAPNHLAGKVTQWQQTAQDGSQNGFVAQDPDGRLCQIVNGTILPLSESDGALRLYMPAPNLHITHRDARQPHFPITDFSNDYGQAPAVPLAVPAPVVPTSSAQISALELEYSKLEHELKELDKTEVIHGKTMSKPAKEALVAKRRELIISMDHVRKALKALRDQPAQLSSAKTRAHSAHALIPPADLHDPRTERASSSDRRSVQQNEQAYASSVYGINPYMPLASPYALPSYVVPENAYLAGPFMLPPPGLLANLAPYDGTHAWPMPFQGFAEPTNNATRQDMREDRDTSQPRHDVKEARDGSQPRRLPQHDGTASKTDLRSPTARQSHALSVKDPETKQVVNLKSLLDPKSPVYKPTHQQESQSTDVRSVKAGDAVPSQSRHKHTKTNDSNVLTITSSSSSIGSSSDKENEPPCQLAPIDTTSTWQEKHSELPSGTQSPPTVPPGTPVSTTAAGNLQGFDNLDSAMRKNGLIKQDDHGERPNHEVPADLPSPCSHDGTSSDKVKSLHNERTSEQPSSLIDFSNKSPGWILGYQAGLQRRAVGADCDSTILDGYCSGLLKSQPNTSALSLTNQHVKAFARDSAGTIEPPIFTSVKLTNQAYDEAAVLSPDESGPSVDEISFNLGTWQKHQQDVMSARGNGLYGFPFPERNSSLPKASTTEHPAARRLSNDSGFESITKFSRRCASHAHPAVPLTSEDESSHHTAPPPPEHGNQSFGGIKTSGPHIAQGLAYRPFSDSYTQHMSNPLQWRTASSMAHVAHLSSSLFANAQFDGQPSDKLSSYSDSVPMLSNAAGIAGAGQTVSRFKEASLDGLSPTISPQSQSPGPSPKTSPRHVAAKRRQDMVSPQLKPPSPTKARLEHLVGKVGIRVSPDKEVADDSGSSPSKHRWRDIWKGTRRDTGHLDTN